MYVGVTLAKSNVAFTYSKLPEASPAASERYNISISVSCGKMLADVWLTNINQNYRRRYRRLT